MTEAVIEKTAGNVVTSENLAAFNAQKLGLETIEKKEPVVKEQVKTEEKAEAAKTEEVETEEQRQEKESKREKLNKRFSEVTAQRREAEAKAERERIAREAAERERDELKAKLAPQPVDPNKELDPKDYKDAFEYAEAVAKRATEKALAARENEEKQARARQEAETRVKAFSERTEAFKKATADWDEVISAAADLSVSNELREAIIDSELGPQLQYYLASNPEELERLGKLTIGSMYREVGKIEAKLEKPKAEEKEVEEERIVSKAKPPITPLKGAAAPAEPPINGKGEFTGSYKEWKAGRKAGKIH